MKIIPWGLVILLIYQVPKLVAGANRLVADSRDGKVRIHRAKKAETFREHIYAGTLKALGDVKKKTSALAAVTFPISGSDCQLRVDVAFGFSQYGRGPARMKASDRDNLQKMFFDGLEGALIDDDKWITEGFVAKGQAPPDLTNGDEVIWATVSRAGFRDAKHLHGLTTLDILPPWRPHDQSKIKWEQSGKSKIIKPNLIVQ